MPEIETIENYDAEQRPYPNEHACRLFTPVKGAPTRRVNGEREHDGKKYDVIYQKKDGKWQDQAYRYKKNTWTASQARSHCKSHDGILFEPASQSDSDNESEERATWTTAYVNDLLDSSFLYIESGEKKDENGKTTPRSLRHFPYKDANGKVDLPHLKNALSRIPQSNLPQVVKDRIFKKAQSLYNNLTGKKSDAQIDREVRSYTLDDAEMRIDDGEKPKLVGYAAKYGIKTNIGYFIEKIKAGAFDEVLKSSDSRALKNHDPNLLLGRESSGTLRLESNSVGLKFEIDVPDTTTGKDTVEEIRRGDLSGCSFAFRVAEDEWKHFEDNRPSERTIIKIDELFDVGPVTYPAYQDTTVAVRSLEIAKTEPQEELNEAVDINEQLNDKKEPDKENLIDEKQQRLAEIMYNRAGRLINRNTRAEDSSVAAIVKE